jgi:hypothetical protein
MNLGAYAGSFIEGRPYAPATPLPFADTAERRAAFGYQVLTGLVSGGLSPADVSARVVRDGSQYLELVNGQIPQTETIKRFVDVFVEPIIDYLEGAQDIDDLTLATMVKYKQRSEWFETERLLEIARYNEGESSKPFVGQAELRLKKDFYRYLFDQGLEFVIEARSPKGGGATDVLTARLGNGRRLIVEAKVYDGKGREKSHVSAGIQQAASYAEEWAEHRAYLLVYNVFPNAVLEFPGTRQDANFWLALSLRREIRIVDVNLNNTLPASQANKISRHTIEFV